MVKLLYTVGGWPLRKAQVCPKNELPEEGQLKLLKLVILPLDMN